jgi:tetratricopeptide (TPR) repeat protein
MASQDVSACLIVRDAEALLPRCLESIAGLVGEVIVVDTGSKDATASLARSLGCRVHTFAWADDFSAARNESLRHATGRWVLSLDADEYFDEPDRRKLRDLLAGLRDAAAYLFTQRSLLANGSPLDLPHTRLFRNHPAIRWQYRVHEQIAPAVTRLGHPIHPTDIVLQHSGYEDPRLHRGKVERNARLLELDRRERPHDPFILFNLATAHAELDRPAEAVGLLRECVRRTPRGHALGRAAYAAWVQCHVRSGQRDEAWAVSVEGRRRYPQDVPLLFGQAQLLRDRGDLGGAEQRLLELIRLGPGPSSGSDAALRRYVAPHTLGLVYAAQGRLEEAERQLQAVLAEYPFYKPSWDVLAELYLARQRWDDLNAVIGRFEGHAEWATDGAVLRARELFAKKDFVSARTILQQRIARDPAAVAPRFYLTHMLMAEGKDWPGAVAALRELLRLDPHQAQGWYNLAVVLRGLNRQAEAREACETGLRHCPGDPYLTRMHEAIRGGR